MMVGDVAIEYIRRGWNVIPIPFRSKNPGFEGWQNLRLTEEEIPQRFPHEQMNVGALLGKPSNGLIDLDLDHALAVKFADEYLPPTPAIFGRAGKPRSHRLYYVSASIRTKKFRHRKHGMLVEIRSTGAQTVFPGSTHPSSELIEWETDSAEPAQVDPEVLRDSVDRLVERVRQELGDAAKESKSIANDLDDVSKRCLKSMRRMKIEDQNDGSHRLYSAACRTVEFDLEEEQALACIRAYETQRPFPTEWSDDDILTRIHDAEERVDRGTAPPGMDDGDSGPDRQSQATLLIGLCDDVDFLHHDDVAYATITDDERIDTISVRSRAFKRWLGNRFYKVFGKGAGGQAYTDAITVLEGKAFYDCPQVPVYVRLAMHDGSIYLDLADDQRRVIETTASGWQVCSQPPVRFRRPRGVEPLPMPERGGSLNELRTLLNLDDDRAFILITAWLVAAFRPDYPVPILVFSSEQGSGKSTATRFLRMTVDPNVAAIRCVPRSVRDLMIAAKNGWIVALDNLSTIPIWLSDALCRLSTGGGFGTRSLYENDEEQLFNSIRPAILNGIEEIGSRSDLLDRMIRVCFPEIPEHLRLPERVLYAKFTAALPRILGAVLDAVSMAVRRIDSIHLDSVPRMADFAMWVVAAEPALPWNEGAFMEAYTENRDSAHELAIEASAIGPSVIRLAEMNDDWTGRATDLLESLSGVATDAERSAKGWPKQANALSGQLSRIAPNLRKLGIDVVFSPRRRTGRTITIRKMAQRTVTTVTDRHPEFLGTVNGDTGDDQRPAGDDGVTMPAGEESPLQSRVTVGDDGDDDLQGLSGATNSDVMNEIEERAAILEFDAGMPRPLAEAAARAEIVAQRNGHRLRMAQ